MNRSTTYRPADGRRHLNPSEIRLALQDVADDATIRVATDWRLHPTRIDVIEPAEMEDPQ